MSSIPLRLLVPGRVYRYSWRGINQDEEQRKKLIPAEILPLEENQIGHEFENEGLFMYLEKNTDRGYPVPVGYVNRVPPLGFKGKTPEEHMKEGIHYDNLKVILPPSSFIFSELDRPDEPAAGPVGAGAGPAAPAPPPPPPPPSKKEKEAAAKYYDDVEMAGGKKKHRHSRTKRHRRRRRITRKRV